MLGRSKKGTTLMRKNQVKRVTVTLGELETSFLEMSNMEKEFVEFMRDEQRFDDFAKLHELNAKFEVFKVRV